MPRTVFPPTPASSTDINGKDGTKQLSTLQMTFELPPPAMNTAGGPQSDTNKMKSPESSPKTAYPIQPSEAVKSRRRLSTAAAANNKDTFALPPPPTRSRKIIQMKPPRAQDEKKAAADSATTVKGSSSAGKRVAAAPATSEAGSSKKKQPSSNSAAGRKIARKTAHSLIERRRRSKMNEEFAVLKNMIPACTGEMHKLAILQASIEYVRYLQDCIEKLKEQREDTSPQTPTNLDDTPSREIYEPERRYRQTTYTPEEQSSPDIEMTGSDIAVSPTCTVRPNASTIVSHPPSESPALIAQDASPVIHPHSSYSSMPAAIDNQRHYSFSAASSSPAFGPRQTPSGGWYARSNHSASNSTLVSPALGPIRERDLDQEATAALLMLNSDRRGTFSSLNVDTTNTSSSSSGRGMSVKDLLSA